MDDAISSLKHDDENNLEEASDTNDESAALCEGEEQEEQELPTIDEVDEIDECTQVGDAEESQKDTSLPNLKTTGMDDDIEHTKNANVAARDITGKHSSFAQLVRSWETYMNDGTGGQFQPLHVFQKMNLCGPEDGLARLTDAYALYSPSYSELRQPYLFGHTHSTPSTPSMQTKSILDDEDEDEPPPYGLEILNRSRSTPLSTSANSAFGTILKTAPYKHYASDRSAFTLPLHRTSSGASSSSQNISSRQTTFNPIRHDKDLEAEMTSIEVTDVPARPRLDEKPNLAASEEVKPSKNVENKSAGSAAKFLSDVSKNFRRRYIQRGGRDNPARPPSTSDDSSKKCDEETISSKSSASTNGSSCLKQQSLNKPCVASNNVKTEREQESPSDTPYQELDSDHDDGPPFTSDYVKVDGTETISSTPYHNVDVDQPVTAQINRVNIEVSTATREPSPDPNVLYAVPSPEPSELAADCNTEASSNDSWSLLEASRCSSTTHTSGHTTQASSTSNSSGQLTRLSVISETDREVIETIKAGKLLNQNQATSEETKGDSLTKSIPLSRNVRYRDYVALPDSPVDLREGANVPADRFFTLPGSHPAEKGGSAKIKNLVQSKKSTSNSPTTISSASASMTTNSSSSSATDAPPTFVSYLDRKLTSDLSFMRETVESSSPRADDSNSEKRESSPAAEMLGYTDVVFEEAEAPPNAETGKTTSKKPRPIWPTKGFHFGRRVRSLPPRSPHKGSRTPTTPPPPSGSVSPALPSPPRNIVDHRMDPNVAKPKPSVVIRRPVSSRLLHHETSTGSGHIVFNNRIADEISSQGGHEVVRIGTEYESWQTRVQRGHSPPIGFRSRTYDEHSIEILKTDSKEDSSSPTLLVDSN